MPFRRFVRLENNFKSELHRARPAHLVQRIQDAQRIRKCGCGLTKQLLAKGGVNLSEVRMVKNIEGLCAKLQPEPFMDRKISPDCQVHLHRIETAGKVAWSITQPRTHVGKSVGIDRPASRTSLPCTQITQPLKHRSTIRAVEIDWLTRDQIQPGMEALP